VTNIKGGESLVVNPGTVGGVAAPARISLRIWEADDV